MALVSEIFEERVAAAMASSAGRNAQDVNAIAVCHRSPGALSNSTRASSPDQVSSSSDDGNSWASSPGLKSTHTRLGASSVLERRGIRAAILGDLGIDLDGSAQLGQPQSTTHRSPMSLTGTRPAPGQRTPCMDASQRSPLSVNTPPTANRASVPMVNSRISPNCLGSAPGSVGDASQRRPGGYPRPSPAGGNSWGAAMASMAATRTAAATPLPMSPQATQPVLTTPGKTSKPLANDASRRESARKGAGSSTSFRVADATLSSGINHRSSEVALNQILSSSGLESLSNEDLAERLRAAAPLEYDD